MDLSDKTTFLSPVHETPSYYISAFTLAGHYRLSGEHMCVLMLVVTFNVFTQRRVVLVHTTTSQLDLGQTFIVL